jgi:hypothetical protein
VWNGKEMIWKAIWLDDIILKTAPPEQQLQNGENMEMFSYSWASFLLYSKSIVPRLVANYSNNDNVNTEHYSVTSAFKDNHTICRYLWFTSRKTLHKLCSYLVYVYNVPTIDVSRTCTSMLLGYWPTIKPHSNYSR